MSRKLAAIKHQSSTSTSRFRHKKSNIPPASLIINPKIQAQFRAKTAKSIQTPFCYKKLLITKIKFKTKKFKAKKMKWLNKRADKNRQWLRLEILPNR